MLNAVLQTILWLFTLHSQLRDTSAQAYGEYEKAEKMILNVSLIQIKPYSRRLTPSFSFLEVMKAPELWSTTCVNENQAIKRKVEFRLIIKR